MPESRVSQQALETGSWRQAIESRPQLAMLMGWVESAGSLDDVLRRAAGHVQEWGPALVAGSIVTAIQLLITALGL